MTTQINSPKSKPKTPSRIKKWSIRSLVFLLVVTAIILLWVEYQMKYYRGEFMGAIETSDIIPINGEYIITNVHLLNPQGTEMLPQQDVIINNGKIKQIGTKLNTSAQLLTEVKGEGRYLIPGLMDGHTHLTESPNDLWLFLVNGVTHLRDMGGNGYHLKLRDERQDQPLWPDLFVASEKVYTTPWYKVWFTEWTRTRIALSSAENAADTVNGLKANGFDALKISGGLTASHYESLLKAAQQADLLVVGHIPINEVSLDQFLTMGQQEIAHIEELTKAFEREFGLKVTGLNETTVDEYLNYVEIRSQEIAELIKAKGTHITTTIWLMESLPKQKLILESFLKTVELAYVNPNNIEGTPLVRGWLPGHHSYASSDYWFETAERTTELKLYWETYVDAIHIMIRALLSHDVEFTAGTDAITTGVVPGFSLHDELESLVNLGMSSDQALQTATRIPGQWLSKVSKTPQSGQTGQIKAGYKANLVLLRDNPLDDIKNT
ncbi:hypothetical protein MNBD_GAMMA02-1268, partial [hydrothermal vent metagenome]